MPTVINRIWVNEAWMSVNSQVTEQLGTVKVASTLRQGTQGKVCQQQLLTSFHLPIAGSMPLKACELVAN